MAKIPPNINKLITVSGIAKTAMRPTPASIAYTGANLASQAFTGKTIPQHLAGLKTGPATGTGNVGRNRKGKTIQEGPSNPTPKQKSKKEMRVGQFSKGGVVSHKSISACESSMRGKK